MSTGRLTGERDDPGLETLGLPKADEVLTDSSFSNPEGFALI